MTAKNDIKIAQKLDSVGQADDNLIRLSTGAILEARQANPSILIRVMTATKRPEPPLVFMKSIGREMENSDDPDYIERVKQWQMEYNSSMLSALIGLGTAIHSKPKGMPAPEDDSWIEDYKALNLPVMPNSKNWRYISWVMFIAAPTDEDINAIGNKVKMLSGVREEDVQDAESFPRSDKNNG
jgi:hypothetical protein